MTARSEWQFILCHDCGKRISPRCAHRPSPHAFLCDDCVDYLPSTTNQPSTLHNR